MLPQTTSIWQRDPHPRPPADPARFNISNPFVPTEVGHYLSPPYSAPGGYEIAPGLKAEERTGRQTREVAQDPDTGLIYVTDGNGGGLTVLRYTGALPPSPMPTAR